MIQLFDHQIPCVERGLEILREFKLLYLAMEMRTGKSITAMEIARLFGSTSVLFLTKKKAMPSIAGDFELMGKPFEMHLLNYEMLHHAKKYYDLIIIDEAHSIGAYPKPGSWQRQIRVLSRGLPIIFLSGTPNPNTYSELFHQYQISSFSPWKEYINFYKWASKYVLVYQKMIAGMLKNQYDKAQSDVIQAEIAPYVVSCSQEEAGFTCEVNEYIRWVPMPDHLVQIFKDIDSEQITYWKSKVASCTNGADITNKLCQISGGTLIFDEDEDNEDDGVVLDDSKAVFIKQQFAGKKLAIFYRFRAEEQALIKHFPNFTKDPEVFNSSTGLTFLGQVTSVREGVNLSTADALVMYNVDFSARSYFQARSRLQTKLRTTPTPMYWIFYDRGIEPKVYARVQQKKDFTWNYYKETKERFVAPDLKRPTTNKPIPVATQLSFDDMIKMADQL